MKEIFEPYSCNFLFESGVPCSADEWERTLIEFMDKLSGTIVQAGPCIIGHLKGFAHAPDLGFAKISTVGAEYPSDISGNLKGCGKRLSMDLNVLVYGLTRDVIEECTIKIVGAIGKTWHGSLVKHPSDARHSDCCKHTESNCQIDNS